MHVIDILKCDLFRKRGGDENGHCSDPFHQLQKKKAEGLGLIR